MTAATEATPLDALEGDRKVKLVLTVLHTMLAMAALGFVASLFEPRNELRTSALFYVPTVGVILGLRRVARSGRVVLVAWTLSLMFWALIALVTMVFGGLQGENAACFGVSALLVGSVVSGRAGVAVAIASSAWCLLVALLEVRHLLPPPPLAYSPLNAWTAFTISLILMSVLMRNSLESLQQMHQRAAAAAAERDEVLRRSIQAQKMELVGNLASGIAHDFNNLLTVIGSVSEALRDAPTPRSADEQDLLDDLDDATSRAVLMTRQLLSLARNHPAEMGNIDLAERVLALAPMIPRLIGSKISVEVDAEPGAVVRATAAGLEQVLLNLVVNARDAMPGGGRLSIGVLQEAALIRLVVRDTGVGMDAATQRRIFAPFFTTKATGTGLGLATVREKVEQFGGTITLESQVGQGTRFEIRLARAAGLAISANPPPHAPNQASHLALLLVEDDNLVGRATARGLEQAGFEVTIVANGEAALARLAQPHTFVCVLSDLNMPVLDGEHLAAQLAARYPGLPLVLMSGNRVPDEATLGPHRRFFQKPVPRDVLISAIEELRLLH